MKVQYISEDGKIFPTAEDCKAYEKSFGCSLFSDRRMYDLSKFAIYDTTADFEEVSFGEYEPEPKEDFWSVFRYIRMFYCPDEELMRDIYKAAKASPQKQYWANGLTERAGLWRYDETAKKWRNYEQEHQALIEFFRFGGEE